MPPDLGVPFPARHEQAELGGAPAVLVHQHGLARGPATDHETIARLVANTTTATGLRVTCRLDRRTYAVGRKVSDEGMEAVDIVRDSFRGEWNYTVVPASR